MLEQSLPSVRPSPILDTPEDALVEALVDYCNERIHRGARDGWVAVAERIVATLWNGDIDAALDPSADSHATWRAFLGHPELKLDRSMLSRCRSLLRLRREIPRRVFNELRIWHLFALAPVDDAESRRELALRAAGEGWSVATLRGEVAARTGRQSTASATKSSRRAIAVLERLDLSAIQTLPAEQARQELDALDVALRDLRRRVKQLLGALAQA